MVLLQCLGHLRSKLIVGDRSAAPAQPARLFQVSLCAENSGRLPVRQKLPAQQIPDLMTDPGPPLAELSLLFGSASKGVQLSQERSQRCPHLLTAPVADPAVDQRPTVCRIGLAQKPPQPAPLH